MSICYCNPNSASITYFQSDNTEPLNKNQALALCNLAADASDEDIRNALAILWEVSPLDVFSWDVLEWEVQVSYLAANTINTILGVTEAGAPQGQFGDAQFEMLEELKPWVELSLEDSFKGMLWAKLKAAEGVGSYVRLNQLGVFFNAEYYMVKFHRLVKLAEAAKAKSQTIIWG